MEDSHTATGGPSGGNPPRDEASEGAAGRRDRKERILHTRISEQLAEELRRAADELRVPVSNLVRNVLEEAFTVVESVTDNVGGWIEEVIEEADRARSRLRGRRARAARSTQPPAGDAPPDTGGPLPDVLGWQPLVLARGQRCVRDGRALAAGHRAWVGLGDRGPLHVFLCGDCLDSLP